MNRLTSFGGRGLAVALSAVSIVAAVACATGTQLQRSWVKADLGPLNFRKVVAVAVSKSPERRRLMEETMAGEITRVAPEVQAICSYTLVGDHDFANESRLREEINHAGFDGAVVMRVTDVNREDVYVPGRTDYAPVYYRTFWGYYHYWVPIAYEPSYVEQETNVRVETEVYSTAGQSELVYSAVSRTFNPSSPADLVSSVAKVVAEDMKGKGLLRNGMSSGAR